MNKVENDNDNRHFMAENSTSTQLSEASTASSPVTRASATILAESETFRSYQPEYQVPEGAVARLLSFARKRFDLVKRLLSFLVVGGLGAIVNIVIFTFSYNRLEHSSYRLVAYLVAFVLATEISLLFNFFLNDQVTFRHLRGQKRSWIVRCARFHVTSIGGTLLTLAISFTLLNIVHLSALFAQAIALIIATAFNFAFHHLFTYRHHQEEPNITDSTH